jgi:signal transduction histidine kinase
MQLGEVALDRELLLEDDEIVCDGEQIVQSLLALMINAVEAMPDGGRLRISTAEAVDDPGWVLLSVSDSGPGIPDEVRDRIFDPFFSTKIETKGVGLGLAVVYGIVRRHGGTISIDSTPDTGATFTVRLPRRPARAYLPEVETAVAAAYDGSGDEELQ